MLPKLAPHDNLPGVEVTNLSANRMRNLDQPDVVWGRLLALWVAVAGGSVTAAEPAVDYLSDHPEYTLSASQSWGVLGRDTAAHAPDLPGEPLQIAGHRYGKGLGHHAAGSIVIFLEAEHRWFESEVGLQPCGNDSGSVVFRVLVDGTEQFSSGVMRATDSPKPIRVPLDDAQELRLEVTDAGDGINCDMANWADARLVRSPNASPASARIAVDVAPFGRVVSWDPNRRDGTRANRLQEFPAADLFLETELPPAPDRTYAIPVSSNGLACIGLEWLNRRALKELRLELTGSTSLPNQASVRVEGWFGESRWQGEWKPLAGELQPMGRGWSFRLFPRSPAGTLLQTEKARWIFQSPPQPLQARTLQAFTRSRWQTARLRIEWDQSNPLSRRFEIIDGAILEAPPANRLGDILWVLTVQCSRPSSLHSDRTVLRLVSGSQSVGVAIADALAQACVYLPDLGVLVSRADEPVTLAEYRARIEHRTSILEEVRQMPEQTLAQALARTHHPAQNEGPVMLSLAGGNTKWVLEREGDLFFQTEMPAGNDWFGSAAKMQVRLAGADPASRRRALEGGWLPIVAITMETADGLLLKQTTFAAPTDEAASSSNRWNQPAVCVAELTLRNPQPAPAPVQLDLLFQGKRPLRVRPSPGGQVLLDAEKPVGWIVTRETSPLAVEPREQSVRLTGALPAGSSAWLAVCLSPRLPDIASLRSPADLRSATETYWRSLVGSAAQIETPDPLLNDIILSSRVRCLAAARNEAEGARLAPWIAAMTYGPLESEAHSVIRGMDFLGHADFARKSLDYMIRRYNDEGFLTTGYTTFGTAWHLWTLGEHWQLTRDTNWLRSVAPEIARVGRWIVQQLDKTRKPGAPIYGLMPPGVLADWNSYACHFTLNAYYHVALRQLGFALADLQYPGAASFTAAASELKTNILRAYRWTQSQSPALPLRNGTWIPHYPSQVHSPGPLAQFFPGQDAGRAWAYDTELGAHQLVPAGVFDPMERETERIMNHMEDVQFLGEGWFDYPAAQNQLDWFNLGGFAKVQPYYARNCEVYALRDGVKPFLRSYFNSLASLLNREVLTFWEHFRHSGAWDKTHETGYFLHQTRTMLVQERGDQLWLAPFIPSDWLADGQSLRVANAPTRFGPVGYTIQSQVATGQILALIRPPRRQPPKTIILRLRLPTGLRMRSITVGERPHDNFDPERSIVTLPASEESLTVRIQVAGDE